MLIEYNTEYMYTIYIYYYIIYMYTKHYIIYHIYTMFMK